MKNRSREKGPDFRGPRTEKNRDIACLRAPGEYVVEVVERRAVHGRKAVCWLVGRSGWTRAHSAELTGGAAHASARAWKGDSSALARVHGGEAKGRRQAEAALGVGHDVGREVAVRRGRGG